MPQLLLLLFLCIGSAGLTAQPAVVLERLAETFTEPTDLVSDGFNTDYLYVVEKPGFVNRYDLEGGAVSLVLDLSDQVEDNGEGGALGMAFHPAFPDSNYVYVNYTAPAPAGQGDLVSRISRFTLDNVGIVFDLSERILLSIPQPAGNHNAGDLAFGPDGYLYIPLGDGGGGNDQYDNAQDPTSLLGSLLRIDVDSTTGDQNYAVPADNPYVNSGDTLPEIWAMGLRNPWRISFDREGGGLWIADVGQGRREEVNYVAAGAGAGTNFGWNCREGLMAFGSPSSRCAGRTAEDFTDPVLDYAHDESQRVNGTSITGGFVYRGDAEDLRGYYVFGDFGRQRLFLYPADSDAGADDIIVYDDLAAEKISTFGEGVNGELYVADISGRIYLVTTEAATPTDETRSGYSQMRVFPNPASDRLTVELSAPVSGEATVSYRSVDGRVAARDVTVRFSNGRADLLVPELPAGIYMLSTFVEGKRFMARIVFQ
ncbi:PQQ-dependent sugar dehydrogenase [Lewinella sp. IMCC34191]|uniref:PQQ-dependent sugar dehydrogenase n=1 Tax=Lewinella sp. IMCC34191 TaxID=2259172 RepID=UPI000E26504F|nr:PQQ-dependent sugar dehydrogenase [Lewinella sp. IMCC34191]